METRIIISQIFILAVVVLIGAIAAGFKVLTRDTKDMLSKVIFNISLPLMLFTNFLKLEATPRLISNSFIILSISGFVILFMLFFGWITSRVFRLNVSEAAVFRVHSMFGNTIFLGFPLITSLFGEEGLLYASMYQLIHNILMWTVGVVVINHGKGTSVRSNFHKVLNPNTIATITGLIFFMLSIRLPNVLLKPLTELGAANTWLSMLYIGAMLAFSDVSGLLRRKSIYLISINRLFIVPAILLSIFYLFGNITGLSPDKIVTSVILLEASMPCMATVVIMAKEFGADDHLAVGNVFVSTIISIISLPLMVMFITRLLA